MCPSEGVFLTIRALRGTQRSHEGTPLALRLLAPPSEERTMSEPLARASARIEGPPASGRIEITVTPEGDLDLADRLPGMTITYVFATPGREQFRTSFDVEALLASGESPIRIQGAREIPLVPLPGLGIRSARLLTDSAGMLTHAEAVVEKRPGGYPKAAAWNFINSAISEFSFTANTPITIGFYQEEEHETGARTWVIHVFGPTVTLTVGSDWRHAPAPDPNLRRLYAMYREGLNATNPFYQFLCFWKVMEGCFHLRDERRATARESGQPFRNPEGERVPADVHSADIHQDDRERMQPYAGKKFTNVRDSLRDVLRNAIAHLDPAAIAVDPDDYDDYRRCERAVVVIRYIARVLVLNERQAMSGT